MRDEPLVTPWNPTPEAEKWLQDTVGPYGVKVVWDGLTVFDQLAAKYPDVIDYYLHGGRSAIQETYREVMTMMSLGSVGEDGLTVPDVADRIARARQVLDHDPHYFYEVRSGRGQPPEPPKRPRLVMSQYRVDPAASTWLAIDVVAYCDASFDERPITINGSLNITGNPEFVAAVKDFVEFGTPFTSPKGVYSGTLDAPGGLGGELVNATIRTGPAEGADLGSNTELHLEILEPDGTVIAQVDVDRTDRSSGTAGVRVVLAETRGVFELTFRGDLTRETTNLTFTLGPIEGIPVSAALPALEFLGAFHHPNTYRISVRHTPGHLGRTADIPEAPDADLIKWMKLVARRMRLLHELQQHTTTVITTPDPRLAQDQYKIWYLVATILRGEPVTVTAHEGTAFQVELEPGTTAPTGTFTMRLPLQAPIGDQTITFGTLLAEFIDAEFIAESVTTDGHPVFAYTTPSRTMRYLPDAGSKED